MGSAIGKHCSSSSCSLAMAKPFSWGIKRGPFSFVKENGPLCPVQRLRRCYPPRGALRRLKLWEQVNDLREHEKRRLNA